MTYQYTATTLGKKDSDRVKVAIVLESIDYDGGDRDK